MKLSGKKVAYLIGPGFEDLEFWVPVMRLKEEGAQVTVVGIRAGEVYTGKTCLEGTADVGADEVKAADFDAVVVPGGWAPDKIRRYEPVKKLVREAYQAGKIVGMICHAGLVGISAGIVEGHESTGSLGIKDDLVECRGDLERCRRPSVAEISCGGEWWRISPISAGSWSLHWQGSKR
jgi:protease I